jgi:DNA helicase HerA-like ATPase
MQARLIHSAPRLYAAFLLWLLAELFEQLPEAGDPPVPKLVLFFDEAHLLFSGAPKPLLDKIEQVVRLIRSKGVGVYFITQNPMDLPDNVLGQLGLKVQHALRAFTPKDQKSIRAVAASFVPNPQFQTVDRVTTLGIGEALVSVMADDGRPQPVRQTLIAPPEGRIGPLSDDERAWRSCSALPSVAAMRFHWIDNRPTKCSNSGPKRPRKWNPSALKTGSRRRLSARPANRQATGGRAGVRPLEKP